MLNTAEISVLADALEENGCKPLSVALTGSFPHQASEWEPLLTVHEGELVFESERQGKPSLISLTFSRDGAGHLLQRTMGHSYQR